MGQCSGAVTTCSQTFTESHTGFTGALTGLAVAFTKGFIGTMGRHHQVGGTSFHTVHDKMHGSSHSLIRGTYKLAGSKQALGHGDTCNLCHSKSRPSSTSTERSSTTKKVCQHERPAIVTCRSTTPTHLRAELFAAWSEVGQGRTIAGTTFAECTQEGPAPVSPSASRHNRPSMYICPRAEPSTCQCAHRLPPRDFVGGHRSMLTTVGPAQQRGGMPPPMRQVGREGAQCSLA